MGPYRTPPPDPNERESDDGGCVDDDRVLGWLLLLIGGIRVTIAFAQHEVFEASSSIALFMVAMAIGLLLRPR